MMGFATGTYGEDCGSCVTQSCFVTLLKDALWYPSATLPGVTCCDFQKGVQRSEEPY